jgi:hypothetical protein
MVNLERNLHFLLQLNDGVRKWCSRNAKLSKSVMLVESFTSAIQNSNIAVYIMFVDVPVDATSTIY